MTVVYVSAYDVRRELCGRESFLQDPVLEAHTGVARVTPLAVSLVLE